jgi:FkbM family methyltransferase
MAEHNGTELSDAFKHLYSTYFGARQHEREEIENLPNLLRDCEIFIDVGASLGMYTYFANRRLEGAKIIAIEADPDRFEELQRNCAAWQAEGSNELVAVHAAVGDRRTPVPFFKTGTQISGGFFPVQERSDRYTRIDVPQVVLDDFFEDGRKTLVKIDVEGGELRVLRGAERHFASGTTRFLVEMHWWGDRDRRTTSLDVLRFLYRRGFAIQKTVRVHTSNYHVWPAAGERTLPGYLKVAPLLVAKSMYGRYCPEPVRQLRETILNRLRRRRHAAT